LVSNGTQLHLYGRHDPQTFYHYASDDGLNWTQTTATLTTNSTGWGRIYYQRGRYIMIGLATPHRLAYSDDGTHWSLHSGLDAVFDESIYGLTINSCQSNQRLWIKSASDTCYTSEDGLNWIKMDTLQPAIPYFGPSVGQRMLTLPYRVQLPTYFWGSDEFLRNQSQHWSAYQ
jgi:hypothetical protein